MPQKPGKSDIPTGTCPFECSIQTVRFDNPHIGWEYTSATWQMKNKSTASRYAWKLKCTSNYHFEIGKPSGFVLPGESVEHTVHHVPGILIPDDGVHHFSIYWANADGSKEMHSRQFWSSKMPEGCIHLKIHFTEISKRVNTEEGVASDDWEEDYDQKKQLDDMKRDFYRKHPEYPKPKGL